MRYGHEIRASADVVLHLADDLMRSCIAAGNQRGGESKAAIDGNRDGSYPRVRWHGAAGDSTLQPTDEPVRIPKGHFGSRDVGARTVHGTIDAPGDHSSF